MVIQEYNPSWPDQFAILRKSLSQKLSNFVGIEHVGSTAIPGMCGKPVIDIDIVIKSVDEFTEIKQELLTIGYVHQGDLGIAGREAFLRNKKDKKNELDLIDHHLYVCTRDNEELKRHIHFRNVLRQNPDLRKEYCQIKYEILDKVGHDNRTGYVEMKENDYKWFFNQVLCIEE